MSSVDGGKISASAAADTPFVARETISNHHESKTHVSQSNDIDEPGMPGPVICAFSSAYDSVIVS
jgi:hypothetical protein